MAVGFMYALRQANRKRLKFFRMIRNAYYRQVYSRVMPPGIRKPLAECRSVALLMNGKGIGDAVVASGFVRALRDRGFRVFVVGSPKFAGLYSGLLACDGLIAQEKHARISALRDRNVSADIIVNLYDPDRDEYQNYKSLASIRHAHYMTFNHAGDSFSSSDEPYRDAGRHFSARAAAMLRRLGVPCDDGSYAYDVRPFSPEAVQAVDAILARCGGRPLIFFNTASSSHDRSFSEAFVGRLLERFEEVRDRFSLVVLNSRSESLRERFPFAVFDPCASLEEAVCLLSRANLVVTPDTSFVHFANFFRKRAVCVYNNRKVKPCEDVNTLWGPNYPEARQVLSPKGAALPLSGRSFHGDDLQELDPAVLEQALESEGVLPPR